MKEIVKLDYDEMDVSDPDKMTILPHNWKEDSIKSNQQQNNRKQPYYEDHTTTRNS